MTAFETAFALLMKSLPIDVDWDNKKLPPPIEVEWDCKKCGKSKSGEDKCECPPIKKGEAMDLAWQLLKMPIVPNSFKEEIPLKYSAIFQDPVSNELLDMQAKWVDTPEEWGNVLGYDASYPGEGGELKAEIKHPADDTYNLGDRAISHIGQEEKRDKFSAFGTGVDEEYRRRGYATALYDMLARILHDQGDYKLTSSGPSGLNEMSRGLWGDKESWPVRDDL